MALVLDRIPAWRVGGVNVTGVARQTVREAVEDDVPGLAAEMTYHSVLAIFPLLLLLVGITSLVDSVFNVPDLTDKIVDKAAQVMPDDAVSVLRGFTDEVVASDGTGAIIFGLFGSLWAASAAISTAIKALNRAYDVDESRGFVRKRLLALGLTITFALMMLTATLLLTTGAAARDGIGGPLGWDQGLTTAWNVATPAAAVLLVFVATALLYWLGPNVEMQLRFVGPGALLFVTAWILFSLGFAYYIANFESYNRVYGSLAAVIILLVWLYWSNILLLAGAELNAVLAKRFDEEYQDDPNVEPGKGGHG